jgi:leucyl/phenylalanyl-tRNA---protein transferase
MSAIHWLDPRQGPEAMPEPRLALDEPNGLLAAGGRLEPAWLLSAYANGIFPWYETGQPILWWCPDPRAVLDPAELRVSRSLRRTLARRPFDLSADRAFDAVVAACAEPRRYTDATWITPEMAAAYGRLHRLGYAHSFEAWAEGQLVGGLYGIALGRVFFGESMFAKATDASKVAFVDAVRFLSAEGFVLIDCQLPSEHLSRFGARNIPRDTFLQQLRTLCDAGREPGTWSATFAALR